LDEIEFLPITFTGSTGFSVKSKAFTARRSGAKYRGTMELIDGGPTTSWPDYNGWLIELTDPNDQNQDGIPNLTDNIAHVPMVRPRMNIARGLGKSVVFTIADDPTVTSNLTGTYWVEGSYDLKNWTKLPVGTGGPFVKVEDSCDFKMRFYRLAVEKSLFP
jgi:hypothetical protein